MSMTIRTFLRGSVVAVALLSSGAVAAQAREKAMAFAAGSIRSVADADAALAAAAAERAEIEARYVAEEQACHPKFFTTSCIDKAKDRRRIALSSVRQVEIEANAFKRQTRVLERDKALTERLEKDERERQERVIRQAATPAETPAVRHEAPATPPSSTTPDRVEKHEAKVRQQRAEESAMAEKRAANVAAYEKKQREARERQQKVAQRKAEKEQKRKAAQAEGNKPD